MGPKDASSAINDHLGNYKGFRSSVPGTRDKDQYIYIFHYLTALNANQILRSMH